MRIGNSLGTATTDVLAQTQVKAEGRVQPGLFRFGSFVWAFSGKGRMKMIPKLISMTETVHDTPHRAHQIQF